MQVWYRQQLALILLVLRLRHLLGPQLRELRLRHVLLLLTRHPLLLCCQRPPLRFDLGDGRQQLLLPRRRARGLLLLLPLHLLLSPRPIRHRRLAPSIHHVAAAGADAIGRWRPLRPTRRVAAAAAASIVPRCLGRAIIAIELRLEGAEGLPPQDSHSRNAQRRLYPT